MAEKSNNWSQEQLLIAFNLYCQIPFGRMHTRNPDIIRFADLIGRTPSALAMKLTNIASLDPGITSTGRRGLSGASASDKAMWDEMQQDWEHFALRSQAAVDALLRRSAHEETLTDATTGGEEELNYVAENRSAYTVIRVGQQFFRQSVISAYRGRCCITGLADSRLLVASHIIPWRIDKNIRLNPRNGLCLSSLHDKAFDQGFFTLTNDFKIMTSREIKAMENNRFATAWLVDLEGRSIELPEKFVPLEEFVEWHRNNVFLGT